MDPITWTIIVCLAAGAVVQRIATDGWAKIQGRPLPSLEAQARRQELAQQQALTTGAPGVLQAIADRAASRIANPPPRARWRAELASYVDDLISDFIINVHASHDEKQAEKAEARGEQAPPKSDRLQHVLEVLDAEIVDEHLTDEHLTGERWCRHCVDNHAAGGDELCPSCRAHQDYLAGQPSGYSPNSYPCRNRCGNTNPRPDLKCGTCMVAEHNAAAAKPSAPAPADSTPPTPPAGHPDRDTSLLGRCGHRLYSFEAGPDCGRCTRDREAAEAGGDDTTHPTPASDAREAQVAEPRPDERPESAPPDDIVHPVLICDGSAMGPDHRPDLRVDDVDTPPYGLPAVVDGEVVPPSTPEPVPGPGSTTEGTTAMSESTVINGDVHDPYGAHAHATGCATFVGDIGQQAEIAANNLAALGVGAAAVGEIRGMQDDAAEFLAAAAGAAEVFTRHQRSVDAIAEDDDTKDTVRETYLDRARGA